MRLRRWFLGAGWILIAVGMLAVVGTDLLPLDLWTWLNSWLLTVPASRHAYFRVVPTADRSAGMWLGAVLMGLGAILCAIGQGRTVETKKGDRA